MSDYIKREDAIFIALQQPIYSLVSEIRQLDGIDIVRCRECRYYKRKRGTFKGEPIIFYRCEENNRDVENDDYCFWGERKGDE